MYGDEWAVSNNTPYRRDDIKLKLVGNEETFHDTFSTIENVRLKSFTIFPRSLVARSLCGRLTEFLRFDLLCSATFTSKPIVVAHTTHTHTLILHTRRAKVYRRTKTTSFSGRVVSVYYSTRTKDTVHRAVGREIISNGER